MANDTSDRDLLLTRLADEFAERYRRGERPSLGEYAEKYPELAEDMRDLFPAMVEIERAKDDRKNLEPPAAASAPLIQQLGDFRILREIGRGGMGVVYEAEQISLGRHVALKVLPKQALLERTHKGRFEREAKAAARLHHTNIVPIFAVGEHDGLPYYAMQFIQGLGLDAVIEELQQLQPRALATGKTPLTAAEQPRLSRRDLSAAQVARSLLTGSFVGPADPVTPDSSSPLSELQTITPGISVCAVANSSVVHLPGQSGSDLLSQSKKVTYWKSVAQVGIQVAEALGYSHGQGVLHRDIKPSNLLLDTGGTVWVTDFGLAKADDQENLTHTGDLLGTLRYMPPEAFDGKSDSRSDIYGLGVTLYEMLVLRPAFDERERNRLIKQVTTAAPAPLDSINPAIPADLVTIVHKAMEREAGQRYRTAGELAADLQRFLADEPIQARRVGPGERLLRWCRRNPLVAGAVGAVAAALMAVTVVAVLYASSEHHFATEQTKATQKITNLATDLEKEREKLRTLLKESNRRLAIRNFERGLAAFDKEQLAVGLLWLVESWRSAAAAGDPAWQHAARANLSAWWPHHARLRAVVSHDRPIVAAAISPDGKLLLTSSEDKSARLWDAATGRAIGAPLPHPHNVDAVAFSPDSKTFLTGSHDRLRLWNTATRALIGSPFPLQNSVPAAVFSPSGKTILAGDWNGNVYLWDVATHQRIGKPVGHSGGVMAVAFSPDGASFLTGSSDKSARRWETATGLPIGPPLMHQGRVWAVAFSPDGKTLVTGENSGAVQRWDANTSKPLGPAMMHEGAVRFLAYRSDGKVIFSGSVDRTLRSWDALTGAPLGRPILHQGPIEAGALSRDDKTILVGGGDSIARLWEAASEPLLRFTLPHKASIRTVAFGHDGKVMLTGSHDRTVRLWNGATGEQRGHALVHPGEIWTACFSPDGKTFLTGCSDGQARLWDSATGKPIRKPMSHPGSVTAVAFGPGGDTIIAACQGREVRFWDRLTGSLVGPALPHPGEVDSMALSPDGKTLVTGCDVSSVQIWDTTGRKLLGKPLSHPGAASAAAFHPDGKSFVVGGEDGTAQHWDLATRQRLGPPLQHRGWVFALAFHPDGKTILTGSWDKTARLWDTATGMPLGPAFEHPHKVNAVAFRHDGAAILTGDAKDAARLFRVPPLLPNDLDFVATLVQVRTGLVLDAQGTVQILDNAAWLASFERLAILGKTKSTFSRLHSNSF